MKKSTGPTKTGVMGRWSIFRGKVNDSDHRVQGFLTKIGRTRFEDARTYLGEMYRSVLGRAPVSVSDADTIEFLSRGSGETIKYLRSLKKSER